jgi:hypothetical protein
MNDTNPGIYVFDSFNSILAALGSSPLLDYLYACGLTSLAAIGFILNILSFAVFMDKEFDKVFPFSATCACTR